MSRGAHRVPLVRATRVLQHVAAGLATLLVVGAVGARLSVPAPTAGGGSSSTRVFPDEPRGVAPAPVTVAPSSTPPLVAYGS